ncbi:MAG: PhoH family protein [Bacteroidales bacterium]|nr:PhoH family protein [Bacteroidales bacterium]MBR4980610.1 PhoH family protein [Bacteroidales bacterium]
MPEKKIQLQNIDPIDIYGINDRIINRLCSYFPSLKVTPRDTTIKLKGTYKDINTFENAIAALSKIKMNKRHLNLDDVDSIFQPTPVEKKKSEPEVIKKEGPVKDLIVVGNNGKMVCARTKHQKKLVKDFDTHDLIFALGPAGTGKTYTAIALAVRALQNKQVRRLILTRPAVEAGERLGFLPGDVKEKLDPYLQPLYDALGDMIAPQRLKTLMEEGTIQIAPLAYMRGRTLESAFVILDEAQNTSLGQLKMFLTRMGNNSKFIVTGDMTQIDLPNKEDSGLAKGIKMLGKIRGIAVINFNTEDIVRHPLVSKIVSAFGKEEETES